jgi:hypothetical protein
MVRLCPVFFSCTWHTLIPILCEFQLIFIILLAYFPGVAQVFIYPNRIVICVPSFADNFYAPWRYITHSSADLYTVTSSH